MKVMLLKSADRKAVEDLIYAHLKPAQLTHFKQINKRVYDSTQAILEGKRGICLIAKDGEEVVGYLLGGDNEKINKLSGIRYGEIYDMKVAPQHQRRGVGTQLVDGFLDWARNAGYRRVSVEAAVKNEQAVAFYESRGFASHSLILEQWFEV